MNKFPISPIFIPGNKLEWIAKTFEKGADSIILDLEDSVPESEKLEARENLSNHLNDNHYENLIVRVNPVNEKTGQEDIESLSFRPQSFDSIYSNLSIQWCHNLDKVFQNVADSWIQWQSGYSPKPDRDYQELIPA